jgi:FdhD protein
MGFLLAEGLVSSPRDVGAIAHCGRPGATDNTVEVTAAPGHVIDWDPDGPTQRHGVISSACGVCGRKSIDDLMARAEPVSDASVFPAGWVRGLTDALSDEQRNFAHSGGVHAAALWRADRTRVVVREDVGRHNAVDKVVGQAALSGELPLVGGALVVSGRASFELVQKAVVARASMLVSVSAPSSLAVEAARRCNLTLVAFARGSRFNAYSGFDRIGPG